MSFFVRVSTSENSFNPPLPLKGKWEVALVDLNLNDVPPTHIKHHDVGVRKYKRKDFEPMINLGERGIMMNFYAQVEMDRMIIRDSNSKEDARMRRAFQKYNYGNVGKYGRQTSDFDRWNYKIPLDHFSNIMGIWVQVACKQLCIYFNQNPDGEISLSAVVDLLNLDIQTKENEIKAYIRQIFKGTGGETALTNTPYFRLPLLSYKDGFIKMETPYWLHTIYIAKELKEIFKFQVISMTNSMSQVFSRAKIRVPNQLKGTYYYRHETDIGGTLYEWGTYPYWIAAPTKNLINYVGYDDQGKVKVEWEEQGVAVLLPDIVEETTVGKFSQPLLRLTSWRDGDVYKQFNNLIYVPLRYNSLGNLNIVVTAEEDKIIRDGQATLHFRRRDEI